MPAWAATADTVTGSSPEMTFTATPCSRKYRNTSGALSRMGFSSTTRARGSGVPVSIPASALSHLASSSTRQPTRVYSPMRPDRSSSRSPRMYSGAPSTKVPLSRKVTALHFWAEVKGTVPSAVQPGDLGKAA